MGFFLAEIAWARPAALWLLLLPLGLLLFLRQKRAPETRATGTLDLWLEVARDQARQARGRARRIPPRAWWLLLALCVGSLAVAGPDFRQPPREVLWCFEVDRSPSMYLPVAVDGDRSRYDAALNATLEWLDDHEVEASQLRWRAAGSAIERGAEPPSSWAAPPGTPASELTDFGATSEGDGTVWNRITDAAPTPEPSHWGYFASGGAAIPGPIGDLDGRDLVWDGEALVPGAVREPRTMHVGEGVPRECREIAEIWASERGVLLAGDSASADLTLRFAGTGGGEARNALGQGWSAEVVAHEWRAGDSTKAGAWLADEEVVLVRQRPGLVELAFSEITALGGDPAAFALAWGELFDACMPPGRDGLSLAERQAAGARAQRDPLPSASAATKAAGRTPPAAWLALIATVLAVAAFRPQRRPEAGKSPIS